MLIESRSLYGAQAGHQLKPSCPSMQSAGVTGNHIWFLCALCPLFGQVAKTGCELILLPLSPECCDSCPSCYGFCFFSHFSTQLSFGSLYLLSLGAFLGLIHPMKTCFCWLSRICSLFLFDIFFLLTFPICPHTPSLSTRVVCLPAQCLS